MGGPNCVNGKCLIRGGTFTMGSPIGVGSSDEHPQREITMTGFKVGQTEVSLGDYKGFLVEKQLKAVLSGCASGDATRTIPGKAGETMRDAYEEAFYTRMPGTDPYNPMTNPYDHRTNPQGQFEEFRGGSYISSAKKARAAGRVLGLPGYRTLSVGFRCVWPKDSK